MNEYLALMNSKRCSRSSTQKAEIERVYRLAQDFSNYVPKELIISQLLQAVNVMSVEDRFNLIFLTLTKIMIITIINIMPFINAKKLIIDSFLVYICRSKSCKFCLCFSSKFHMSSCVFPGHHPNPMGDS